MDYDIDLLTNDEMGDDSQTYGDCQSESSGRTNALLNVRGYPYILNDYLENVVFKQIDPAFIKNSISITSGETGRTIVDISVDDTRPIAGNRIKYSKLIEAIFKNVRANRQNILPVFQKALIVQISYQLENQRTGKILKSATEKLSVTTRDYFLDINVQSVSDNAIDNTVITNFTDALTTTVTEFLHGSETMVCRVTGIELFYPAVILNQMPHSHCGPTTIANEHNHGNPVTQSYQYNDLYHFDNNGCDIHLHDEWIDGRSDDNVTLIPVGGIKLDKLFNVNTGHKITFKYSIWKSDIVMIKNSKRIEEILGGAPYRKVHKTIEDILDRWDDIKAANSGQDIKLGEIVTRLDNVMSDSQASDVGNDIINSYKP